MPGLIQIFKFSLGVEGNESCKLIVSQAPRYVRLARAELWDQTGSFSLLVSYCLTLHNPKQYQHMPSGFVLLLSQQFWIPPS